MIGEERPEDESANSFIVHKLFHLGGVNMQNLEPKNVIARNPRFCDLLLSQYNSITIHYQEEVNMFHL